MRRIIALLLACMLLIPSVAAADDLAALKETWLSPYQYYYAQLSDAHKAAWMHDVANVLTYPVFVKGEYKAEHRALARMLRADNPKLFWIDWIDDYGCLQYLVKNTDYINYPMQIEDGLTLADLQAKFLQGVSDAVAAIKKDLPKKPSSKEIVKAIDKWLRKNNTYNDTQTSSHKADCDPVAFAYLAAHSAYSAIIPGDMYEPVCEGYALAFKLLCDEFGIESICISGSLNDVGHMWNYVNLGKDKWYLVDVMNNDRYDGNYFLMIGSKQASKNDFVPDPYMSSGVKPENGYAAEEGATFVFPELQKK